MNGIILAAGRGSRVNQSSKNKPKGMFLYKNKTLIDHILENFKKNMINKSSIVTGYKSKNLKVFSTCGSIIPNLSFVSCVSQQ